MKGSCIKMKKDYLSTIRKNIDSFSLDQLAMLLYIHEKILRLELQEVLNSEENDQTKLLKDFIFHQIKLFTREKDFPTLLKMIDKISNNSSFDEILINN